MPSVWILNGPNLNLLGTREPGVYGSRTLDAIMAECTELGRMLGLEVECRQSNHEGVLVDWIQEAGRRAQGVILNAGAYTHTSIALHDAIRASGVTVIEVHLSNIHAREPFRHHSHISAVARGVIVGFGPAGYTMALEALARMINDTSQVQA